MGPSSPTTAAYPERTAAPDAIEVNRNRVSSAIGGRGHAPAGHFRQVAVGSCAKQVTACRRRARAERRDVSLQAAKSCSVNNVDPAGTLRKAMIAAASIFRARNERCVFS